MNLPNEYLPLSIEWLIREPDLLHWELLTNPPRQPFKITAIITCVSIETGQHVRFTFNNLEGTTELRTQDADFVRLVREHKDLAAKVADEVFPAKKPKK